MKAKLGFNERGIYDFLDALVSLGFLHRKGIKETSEYSNTELSDNYLVNTKPNYMGGFVLMGEKRLYPAWANLEEALKTGKHVNDVSKEEGGHDLFATLYNDKDRARLFL